MALSLAAGACTGTVMDGDGTEGNGTGTVEGTKSGGKGGTTTPGKGGGSDTPVTPPTTIVMPPPTEACKGSPAPAEGKLMRLSGVQYRNTLRDLLTMSGVSAVAKDLEAQLRAVPDDVSEVFGEMNNDVTPPHVEAYYQIAEDTADAISSKPDLLAKVAGACATKVVDGCLDTFFNGFARNAYRRPLTDDEKTFLRAFNDGKAAPAEVFRSLIVSVLASPRFLNHLETDGAPVEKQAGVLLLSPYEIASRLSYTFWRSMPDEALFKAAADNVFKTPAGLKSEVERVFNSPKTKDALASFWGEWTNLNKLALIKFPEKNKAFDVFAKGEQINEQGHDHIGAMISEVRDLTEYVTFTKKGTLTELLTTDAFVSKSADLARLYGTQPWTGMGDPPKIEGGKRSGLLTRAALLATDSTQTNPFHRGALFRKRFLCDPVPSPDPTALPMGALDPPPFDATKTTRQRFDAKMGPNCIGCHTQFNALGYILEAYDAIGRYRDKEKVFKEDGTFVGELPIDVRDVARVTPDDMKEVNGPGELMQRIAESKKVEACFAENFFTYALRRKAVEMSADACVVDGLVAEAKKPNVSLMDVYKRLALESSFVLRKVGAQ